MFSHFASPRASAAHFLPLLFSLCLAIPRVCASVNRTIDDRFGDQATGLYPKLSDGWNACESGCTGIRNPAGAFDQTYVFSDNASVDVTLQFSGTAIYCYGVIPEFGPPSSLGLTIRATLDNEPLSVKAVSWPARLSPDIPSQAYNILLYSRTGLENTEHTLILGGGDGFEQWMSFDYATYTFDGFSKKKNFAAPVTGGVVGGLIVLSAFGFLIYRIRRRRQIARVLGRDIEDPEEKPDLSSEVSARTYQISFPAQPIHHNTVPTTALVSEELASSITSLRSDETQFPRSTPSRWTDEAESQVLSPTTTTNAPRQLIDMDTNAELTAMRTEMRILREQIQTLQQEQLRSMPEPPRYKARISDPSSSA